MEDGMAATIEDGWIASEDNQVAMRCDSVNKVVVERSGDGFVVVATSVSGQVVVLTDPLETEEQAGEELRATLPRLGR
jgi:hypothetical protein